MRTGEAPQSMSMLTGLLPRVSAVLERHYGLKLSSEQWDGLRQAVDRTAQEYELHPARLIALLIQDHPNKEMLAALVYRLTIHETHFFRDDATFSVLEDKLLPALVRTRSEGSRTLKVWSAGCSTGEEAYSLALAIDRLLRRRSDRADWSVTLLGTDVNPNYLRTAVAARYGDWSFRGPRALTEMEHIGQTEAGYYEMPPHIRKMVKFSLLNLAGADYPCFTSDTHAMDIILCRNVLIYFGRSAALNCLQRLTRSLADGGWLIVAPAEAALLSNIDGLTAVNFGSAICFQKTALKRDDAVQAPIADVSRTAPAKPRKQPEQAAAHQPSSSELRQPAFKTIQALYDEGHYAHVVRDAADHTHSETSPSVFALAARACANQGQFNEAIEWCERAIQTDRTNVEWWHLRASLEQEHGHLQQAMASFRRVLYLDPDCVVAHLGLGALLNHAGQAEQASRSYRIALSLLDQLYPERIVPYSEGLSAGTLAELVRKTLKNRKKE